MNGEQMNALLLAQPGLRVVPVVPVYPLWLRGDDPAEPVTLASTSMRMPFAVNVVDLYGTPLPGVTVRAFTNRMGRIGVTGMTDIAGMAWLSVPDTERQFEVVEVVGPPGYWPAYARSVDLQQGALTMRCASIDFSLPGVADHFSLRGSDADGSGVTVGVIDSGVADHPDLTCNRAINLARNGTVSDVSDTLGHGTHVCGIIAGRGAAGVGMRGVAPGVTLNVYKVFGAKPNETDSFALAKAIRLAVDDGCDLVNMSLGGYTDMPDVLREIQRARAMGVVCLAATGNKQRAPVTYPARYSSVLAVAASGRRHTYPAGASQELSETMPFGVDGDDYVADFSNIGPEVGLISAGVGVVSTFRKEYAVLDGTSMACPMATGVLARLLGNNHGLLHAYRDQRRSDAIVKLALGSARPLGFGPLYEGAGMLR